jgi:hypothetical protein
MATAKKKEALKLTQADVRAVMSKATTQTKAHQVVRALCAEWLEEHKAEWTHGDLVLETDTREIGQARWDMGERWNAYYNDLRIKARTTLEEAKKLIEERALADGYKIVRRKK